MKMIPRAVAQIVMAAFVVIGLDQYSKYWLLYGLGMIGRPPLKVTDFFSIVMLWNHGVSFGMLSHSGQNWTPYLLIALAVVISLFMLKLALKSPLAAERVAYGMVIGGALANAIDRVRIGAVADFFYVHVGDLGWPAFNVADSAICVGVCILLLTMLRNPKMAT